jgi:coenzyme F420-reducing hydrogenase delta subunit
MLTEHGFDRQRLRLAWYAADDGAAFARQVNEIVEEIELLGPSPIR